MRDDCKGVENEEDRGTVACGVLLTSSGHNRIWRRADCIICQTKFPLTSALPTDLLGPVLRPQDSQDAQTSHHAEGHPFKTTLMASSLSASNVLPHMISMATCSSKLT